MTADEKNYSAKKSPMENALVALCAAGTVLIISWLIRYSAYGIDFTDESFYLVWVANPFLYDWSATLFGFFYHPLYSVLGGDITALRQANIIITFALAWGLVYSFLASLAAGLKESRITLTVVSASLATSAFILFDSWLVTPSYNSLNLQALLIAATGLVLAEKNADRKSITGWLLIGVGGWVAFMAKPSTALALSVGVFIYLLLARKFSIRLLTVVVSVALALLFVSTLLIDGSVVGFAKRLQLGVEFYGRLDAGHTVSHILRIDSFALSTKFKLVIFFIVGFLSLALWGMYAKNKKWQVIGLLISITFFLITALLTLGQVDRAAGFGRFQGLLIFAVVYAAVITALALGRLRALKSVKSQQWMIAAVFLVMPHINAFGTNGNYWQAGSSAAIFWLLAGLTLLGPTIRERASWLVLLPVALTTQAVTAALLQTGLEEPYRQPQALRLNEITLESPPRISGLILPQDYAEYIANAELVARKALFNPGTPVIDLSGQSPGLLYAIGAENLGQPWTVGGYRGSMALAQAALGRTSCSEIAQAWVLLEKDGPRSISSELLHSLGADFPDGYQHVGSWQTARGAGGYPDRPRQDLYKPVEQHKTLIVCQRLREEAKQ